MGRSRRTDAVLTGRTRQGKLVHFAPTDGGGPAPGAFAEVAVTAAAPHHLSGDVLAVTARPRHRTSIPVVAR